MKATSAPILALLLLASCSERNRTPLDNLPEAAEVAPLDMCQSRVNPDGAYCEFHRCDVPLPCATPEDQDCDGVEDAGVEFDNCAHFCNPDQANADGDYMGDICDPCPNDVANDIDRDGDCGDVDNCPAHYNPNQEDADGDGVGDACDVNQAAIIAIQARLDALETGQAAIKRNLLMEDE